VGRSPLRAPALKNGLQAEIVYEARSSYPTQNQGVRGYREQLSCDKNGVSLMTIHKAKGLEFPVVFVIGMVEGMLPNKQGDIEEERRVAFVGMSRAMRHLYLTYSRKHLGRDVKKSIFIDEALVGNQPN